MRARFLFILSVVVSLALPACKKEFTEGDTILVNDTVTATTAETFSFNHGWSGARSINDGADSWESGDTLGGLRIPFDLQVGDRLIATLQVGLQQLNASHPCVEELHVSIGSVLGNAFIITPVTAGVYPFEGAFNGDMSWAPDVWGRQFTRQQELTVENDMPGGVVQSFLNVWSTNDACTTDTVRYTITNRSLTLTVLHP